MKCTLKDFILEGYFEEAVRVRFFSFGGFS